MVVRLGESSVAEANDLQDIRGRYERVMAVCGASSRRTGA
jgi:hypothetical protein